MSIRPSFVKYPELVFGIAGPIGIDIDVIIRTLKDALTTVGYLSETIKITDEILSEVSSVERPRKETFYNIMRYKMAHASALCREKEDAAYLMRLAIRAIKRERSTLIAQDRAVVTQDDDEESVVTTEIDPDEVAFHRMVDGKDVAFRSAFIIRQIKRPEEVNFLRFVYGKQFILLSGYGTETDRQKILEEKIRSSNSSSDGKKSREVYLSNKLIEQDASEDNDKFGQHLRDAFHLADVIVDGVNPTQMRQDIERFINAFFGLNEVAPTKSEHGMFAAHAASLRSSDLSRQVGAAIFSRAGEVLAEGCNEVPKAFGGTYWDGESPDYRDIKLGKDSNDTLKVEVLRDLIQRLKKNGLLSDKVSKAASVNQMVNFLIGRGDAPDDFAEVRGSLKNAKILDLTEYGRVVHAEMNAICDAARMGNAISGGVLYTTTFPCHNCTKHIIAAGIHEVVFLEPYPKSKAKELHNNEVEIEQISDKKVVFRFFSGITPGLYQKIFSKYKRKKDGVAVRWQHGGPSPMITVSDPSYLRIEELMIEGL
jgi:deoxycytidylate deaminase